MEEIRRRWTVRSLQPKPFYSSVIWFQCLSGLTPAGLRMEPVTKIILIEHGRFYIRNIHFWDCPVCAVAAFLPHTAWAWDSIPLLSKGSGNVCFLLGQRLNAKLQTSLPLLSLYSSGIHQAKGSENKHIQGTSPGTGDGGRMGKRRWSLAVLTEHQDVVSSP